MKMTNKSMYKLASKLEGKWEAFKQDERGEFGIKQIAFTVAIIVIIGFGVTAMRGLMPGWIEDVWDKLLDLIDDTIK